MDKEAVIDDIMFPDDSGDKTIDGLYKRLYQEHMAKGMTLVLAAKSKTFGHYRYLITAYGRDNIVALNLDNNEQTKIV